MLSQMRNICILCIKRNDVESKMDTVLSMGDDTAYIDRREV